LAGAAGRERVEGTIVGVEPGNVFRVFGQEPTLAIDGGPEVGIVPNRHKFGADPFGVEGVPLAGARRPVGLYRGAGQLMRRAGNAIGPPPGERGDGPTTHR
jgi:hypothetical protein